MNVDFCFLSVVPLLSRGWIIPVGGSTPDRLKLDRLKLDRLKLDRLKLDRLKLDRLKTDRLRPTGSSDQSRVRPGQGWGRTGAGPGQEWAGGEGGGDFVMRGRWVFF